MFAGLSNNHLALLQLKYFLPVRLSPDSYVTKSECSRHAGVMITLTTKGHVLLLTALENVARGLRS